MLSDLYVRAQHYHAEYTRRHFNTPEPLEPRHSLKQVIGHGLIHLGERLAQIEQVPQVDEAA